MFKYQVSDEPKDHHHPNGLTNGIKSSDTIIVPERTKEDSIRTVQLMDVNDIVEIVTEESLLQSIGVLNDWLRNDVDVLKSCGSNAGLLRQLTYLINLVNINLRSPKMIGVSLKSSEILNRGPRLPLSEDIVLKGNYYFFF